MTQNFWVKFNYFTEPLNKVKMSFRGVLETPSAAVKVAEK